MIRFRPLQMHLVATALVALLAQAPTSRHAAIDCAIVSPR